MKRVVKKIITLCVCLSLFSVIKPEYLIFKWIPGGMPVALDASDKNNYEYIYKNILCKYQWPMCLAHRQELKK